MLWDTAIGVHFRKTARDRAAEWLLSWVTFTMGLVLLYPAQLFASPTYAGFLKIANEPTWGLIFVIFGVLRMLLLAVNGAFRPSPMLRVVANTLGASLWLYMFFVVSGGAQPGLLFATFPIFVFFDVWNAIRAAEDMARSASARATRKANVGGV